MKKRAVKKIFEDKHKRRTDLSRLSFEKKIEILVEIQKMAGGVRKNPRHIVWPT
jgi:hypothetical protein